MFPRITVHTWVQSFPSPRARPQSHYFTTLLQLQASCHGDRAADDAFKGAFFKVEISSKTSTSGSIFALSERAGAPGYLLVED